MGLPSLRVEGTEQEAPPKSDKGRISQFVG